MNEDRIQHGIADAKVPYAFNPEDTAVLDYEYPGYTPIRCTVKRVHIDTGRPRYDLDLHLPNDKRTRVYNVDSWYVRQEDPNRPALPFESVVIRARVGVRGVDYLP